MTFEHPEASKQEVRDRPPEAPPNVLYLEYERDLSKLCMLVDPSQLTTLTLDFCQVSDLRPLAELTQLTMLHLRGCDEMSDLSFLAGLTRLTRLDLSGCEQVSDLRPLAELTQLTWLNLNYCRQVSDLSLLAGLPQLTALHLQGCNRNIHARHLRALRKQHHLLIIQ